MLTDLGKAQLKNLGQIYRRRYILSESEELKGFFPIEPNSSNVNDFFVLSSPIERTYESFLSLYNGLFNSSKKLKIKNRTISPEFQYSERSLNNEEYLFIHLPEKKNDLYFHAYEKKFCGRAECIAKRFEESFRYQESLNKFRNEIGAALAEETNKKCKTSLHADRLTLKNISNILDLITSSEAHDKLRYHSNKIPIFSKEIMEK
jgi:hypothetical protein